jgi:hypothetical protein
MKSIPMFFIAKRVNKNPLYHMLITGVIYILNVFVYTFTLVDTKIYYLILMWCRFSVWYLRYYVYLYKGISQHILQCCKIAFCGISHYLSDQSSVTFICKTLWYYKIIDLINLHFCIKQTHLHVMMFFWLMFISCHWKT